MIQPISTSNFSRMNEWINFKYVILYSLSRGFKELEKLEGFASAEDDLTIRHYYMIFIRIFVLIYFFTPFVAYKSETFLSTFLHSFSFSLPPMNIRICLKFLKLDKIKFHWKAGFIAFTEIDRETKYKFSNTHNISTCHGTTFAIRMNEIWSFEFLTSHQWQGYRLLKLPGSTAKISGKFSRLRRWKSLVSMQRRYVSSTKFLELSVTSNSGRLPAVCSVTIPLILPQTFSNFRS